MRRAGFPWGADLGGLGARWGARGDVGRNASPGGIVKENSEVHRASIGGGRAPPARAVEDEAANSLGGIGKSSRGGGWRSLLRIGLQPIEKQTGLL